jgi:hypothetical protein
MSLPCQVELVLFQGTILALCQRIISNESFGWSVKVQFLVTVQNVSHQNLFTGLPTRIFWDS